MWDQRDENGKAVAHVDVLGERDVTRCNVEFRGVRRRPPFAGPRSFRVLYFSPGRGHGNPGARARGRAREGMRQEEEGGEGGRVRPRDRINITHTLLGGRGRESSRASMLQPPLVRPLPHWPLATLSLSLNSHRS